MRAVVVTGSGRAFCAGADLGSGERTFSGGERSGRDPGGVVALRIFDCTKPVIAAVNGPAVGVGASMTLAMDARFAAPDATFGFVFTRLGHRARGVLVVVPAPAGRHPDRARLADVGAARSTAADASAAGLVRTVADDVVGGRDRLRARARARHRAGLGRARPANSCGA